MLVLATILDNPGEPSAATRYRDARHLAQLGYNGSVFYGTTGLSGIDSPDSVGSGEMRRWVAQQQDKLRAWIEEQRAARLAVYLTYDALSLATNIVEEKPSQYICRNRPDMLCPASDATLERCGRALQNLLSQLPPVDGVVLRIGDNDAARLPYLVGNDIYVPHCARCSQMGRADRIVRVLTHFHHLVVEQMNLRLIARAWNVRPNALHDSVELCQRVMERLPGPEEDDRFILSFKFTHTDFWRHQQWNPCSLQTGKRPVIYELQCQREFEGKGGIPNWQAPLWRDGMPESGSGGLREVSHQINLAGLWAWVRGGGWGGPFIRNEHWIDANVYAVPRLAQDPEVDPQQLADSWIAERLGVKDPQTAAAVKKILGDSPQVVLKGFYIGPFARNKKDPWHPNADWIQDDLLDAESAWRLVQRLPEQQLDEMVQEKQQAVSELSEGRAALQQSMKDENRGTLEPLVHTLLYAESLFAALRDFLGGLASYRRWKHSRDAGEAEQTRRRLLSAQSHWNQHVQRHGGLAGCATPFREQSFWELTERVLADVGR